MRQIALLPSACNSILGASNLFFSSKKIVYTANLAVYVIDAETFLIEKIISKNLRVIVNITISPHDENYMIIAASNGSICLWDLKEESVIYELALQHRSSAYWDPFSPTHCGIFLNEPNPRFLYW